MRETIVMEQIDKDEKKKEITEVRKMMEMMRLKGKIVTEDELNREREIEKQIVDKGGDYESR